MMITMIFILSLLGSLSAARNASIVISNGQSNSIELALVDSTTDDVPVARQPPLAVSTPTNHAKRQSAMPAGSRLETSNFAEKKKKFAGLFLGSVGGI